MYRPALILYNRQSRDNSFSISLVSKNKLSVARYSICMSAPESRCISASFSEESLGERYKISEIYNGWNIEYRSRKFFSAFVSFVCIKAVRSRSYRVRKIASAASFLSVLQAPNNPMKMRKTAIRIIRICSTKMFYNKDNVYCGYKQMF